MRVIGLSRIRRIWLARRVIARFGQIELALIDVGDDLGRVAQALVGGESEHRVAPKLVKVCDFFCYILLVTNIRNSLQFWTNRIKILLLDGLFVHTGGIVVADLLLVRRALG